MKHRILTALIAGLVGTSLALPVAPLAAADRGRAKQSIKKPNRAQPRQAERRNLKQRPRNRPSAGRNPDRRPDRGNNNRVVAGNTVVVNRNVDRNYHGSHDRGYHHDRWDDDDDNFFEVLGKTAAITAGVAGTAALLGEIFEDEPDDCQQSVSHGTTYLYCNGVWYQPTMAGTNMQYVVVADPN